MIEIVFHLIVLGQAEQVAVLHGHKVFGFGATDVHLGGSTKNVCECVYI